MTRDFQSARLLIKRLGTSLRRTGTRAIALPFPYRMTIAVIPGVVTLVVLLAALWGIRALERSRAWVAHTHRILSTTQTFMQRMVEAEAGHRAFLVVADPTFFEPYIEAEIDARGYVSELRRLTRDNPVQAARVDQLDSLVNGRFSAFRKTMAASRRDGVANVGSELKAGQQAMDRLRTVVRAIEDDEEILLQQRTTAAEYHLQLSLGILIVGGLIAVLVSLATNRMLAINIKELDDANTELFQQALRLEEQATEMESQASELEATASELEATNVELAEQGRELERQRDVADLARADAEQANAAKSRFLSTMSHELRTPLNAVTGYVDLIDAEVHGPVTTEQREDIRRIKRAVAQLTSVINDILNFAKLESGEVRYELGPVQMEEALANASVLMEPQAAAKRIRFSYDHCDPSVVAYADRERVQQIVLNLLSNAVKYTNPGGAVHMRCERRDSWVAVTVSDTGNGISPENVQRIFDPFVQLLNSMHSPSDGVGLGLPIGRDLARGMGGDIIVQSQPGHGSSFELRLPMLKDSDVMEDGDTQDEGRYATKANMSS